MSTSTRRAERFLQRLALLMLSLNPQRDAKLLAGLSPSLKAGASGAWDEIVRLSAEERRVLARESLGLRKDADVRLRRAMAQASPELQQALYQSLPPFFRSLFPDQATQPGAGRPPPRPELRAFAQRVAWEALR